MTISAADLVGVCERASTLGERLSPRFVPGPAHDHNGALVSRRLDRWCENAAAGDWARFTVRLAADGWDLERVRQRLGSVRLAAREPLPAWVDTLAMVLRQIESGGRASAETVFDPFLTVARDRLAHVASGDGRLLSPHAVKQLDAFLVRRLSDTAAAVLSLKFEAFRAVRYPLVEMPVTYQADDPASRQFRDGLMSGAWVTVLREFPVLARLLSTLIDSWVDFVSSFLGWLAHDLSSIQDMFAAPGRALTSVVDVRPGLSDPHCGGRTVMRLTFDSGLALFFKPRNLEMERTWYALLAWLNDHGFSPRFTSLKVLSRDDYGWMECADNVSADAADAAGFWRTGGALLCLLHLLGGTDVFGDNVVACERQPVLVDLETLMQPRVRLTGPDLSRRFPDGVLRTRFLPEWQGRGEADFRWIGGLDVVPRAASSLTTAESSNGVEMGFREMYRFLLDHKADLLAPGSPLHAFARARTRPIFQDTGVYERLCRRSLQPDVLRDGVDRSLLLERLYRLPVPSEVLGTLAPRCREEIRSLERLDVPWFGVSTTQSELRLGSASDVATQFTGSPLSQVFAKVEELGGDDLERQVEMIRASFCLKAAALGEQPTQAAAGSGVAITDTRDAGARQNDEDCAALLTRAASSIVSDIAAAAVHTRDGVFWPIPERVHRPGMTVYRLVPSDASLYSGNCGIALVLSAHARVSGEDAAAELARESLRPVRSIADSQVVPAQATIGAASGLSSLAYGLLKAGMLLNDVALIDAARRAADLITETRIAGDRHLDLYDGAAGAIAALLALHDVTGEPVLLRRAVACGVHLLAARTLSASGQLAWKTIGGRHVSGFAHGMAGIACALLRLFRATGHEPFLHAATEAIAFERATFSPVRDNWRAFGSPPEQPVFRNALCHGAAGIGLARIAGLACLDAPAIRDDIEAAVRATLAEEPGGVDSLCCGNIGRIVFLAAAAQALERPDLHKAACVRAAGVAAAGQAAGSFCLHPDLPWAVGNAALFRGTAGIGYELLRLTVPGSLPCVALWQ